MTEALVHMRIYRQCGRQSPETMKKVYALIHDMLTKKDDKTRLSLKQSSQVTL